MLKWICHFRPAHLHWEGPEDVPSHYYENKICQGGGLASLTSLVVSLCQTDLTIEYVVTKLRNPNAMEGIGFLYAGANG